MNKESFTTSKEAPTFSELIKEMKSEIIIGDLHCYTPKNLIGLID